MSFDTEKPYYFTPGEAVTFYLVDPVTKCGFPHQRGVVVTDDRTLRISVRDEAGEVHRIPSGHLWNEASCAYRGTP